MEIIKKKGEAFFSNLLSLDHDENYTIMDEVLNVIPEVFNKDIGKDLEKDVTNYKIKKTVFSMNADKAP